MAGSDALEILMLLFYQSIIFISSSLKRMFYFFSEDYTKKLGVKSVIIRFIISRAGGKPR
jgi:hypothetical protein